MPKQPLQILDDLDSEKITAEQAAQKLIDYVEMYGAGNKRLAASQMIVAVEIYKKQAKLDELNELKETIHLYQQLENLGNITTNEKVALLEQLLPLIQEQIDHANSNGYDSGPLSRMYCYCEGLIISFGDEAYDENKAVIFINFQPYIHRDLTKGEFLNADGTAKNFEQLTYADLLRMISGNLSLVFDDMSELEQERDELQPKEDNYAAIRSALQNKYGQQWKRKLLQSLSADNHFDGLSKVPYPRAVANPRQSIELKEGAETNAQHSDVRVFRNRHAFLGTTRVDYAPSRSYEDVACPSAVYSSDDTLVVTNGINPSLEFDENNLSVRSAKFLAKRMMQLANTYFFKDDFSSALIKNLFIANQSMLAKFGQDDYQPTSIAVCKTFHDEEKDEYHAVVAVAGDGIIFAYDPEAKQLMTLARGKRLNGSPLGIDEVLSKNYKLDEWLTSAVIKIPKGSFIFAYTDGVSAALPSIKTGERTSDGNAVVTHEPNKEQIETLLSNPEFLERYPYPTVEQVRDYVLDKLRSEADQARQAIQHNKIQEVMLAIESFKLARRNQKSSWKISELNTWLDNPDSHLRARSADVIYLLKKLRPTTAGSGQTHFQRLNAMLKSGIFHVGDTVACGIMQVGMPPKYSLVRQYEEAIGEEKEQLLARIVNEISLSELARIRGAIPAQGRLDPIYSALVEQEIKETSEHLKAQMAALETTEVISVYDCLISMLVLINKLRQPEEACPYNLVDHREDYRQQFALFELTKDSHAYLQTMLLAIKTVSLKRNNGLSSNNRVLAAQDEQLMDRSQAIVQLYQLIYTDDERVQLPEAIINQALLDDFIVRLEFEPAIVELRRIVSLLPNSERTDIFKSMLKGDNAFDNMLKLVRHANEIVADVDSVSISNWLFSSVKLSEVEDKLYRALAELNLGIYKDTVGHDGASILQACTLLKQSCEEIVKAEQTSQFGMEL